MIILFLCFIFGYSFNCFGFINGQFQDRLKNGWIINSGHASIKIGEDKIKFLEIYPGTSIYQDFKFPDCKYRLSYDISGSIEDIRDIHSVVIKNALDNTILTRLLNTSLSFYQTHDLPWITQIINLCDYGVDPTKYSMFRLEFNFQGNPEHKQSIMHINNVCLSR